MSEFNKDNIIIYKNRKLYKCSCNQYLKKFSTCDFKKHIESKKHIENVNYIVKDDDFVCACGIILKCYHESDLIRHNASKTHIERMEILENIKKIEEEKKLKDDFIKLMEIKLNKLINDMELSENYEFRLYEPTNRIQRLKLDSTSINPIWENLCNHPLCLNGTRDLFCKSHNVEINNRLLSIVDELNLSLEYDYRIAPYNKDEIQRKHIDKSRWITMCHKCNFSIPSYNYENETKPIYCGGCKEDDMVITQPKKCVYIDDNNIQCKTYPSFNFNGLTAHYCEKHKLDGMMNVRKNKCIHIFDDNTKCNITANYNYPGECKPLYCNTHKLDDMIANHKPKCAYIDPNGLQCEIYPSYNYKNENTRLYCSTHKLKNMIDIANLSKKCIKENCFRQVSSITKKKYNGFCFVCYINNNPNIKNIKNFRIKENKICDFIKENYLNLDFIYDKACINRKRPDILLDLDNFILIIEIDENQHKYYNKIKEQNKIDEIKNFYNINNINVVFIRFNPDGYKNNNINIDSPWEYEGQKIYIHNVDDWNNRTGELKKRIDYYINLNEKINDNIIEYLFYDNY